MITLVDGYKVSMKSYQYLLAYNTTDDYMYAMFNVAWLHDLTRGQYYKLFKRAIKEELNSIVK